MLTLDNAIELGSKINNGVEDVYNIKKFVDFLDTRLKSYLIISKALDVRQPVSHY